MGNQPGKLVIDQFADRGARHQHSLIDVKLMAAEPRFVGQIGDGNTLVHAANHPLYNAVFLAGGQARSAHIFRNIQRQIQRRQHQLYRLVPWVVSPVTVPDISSAETAYRPAQHVLNGMQLIDCLINKILSTTSSEGHTLL